MNVITALIEFCIIFIIKRFQIIVFIFIVISTIFRPIYPLAFFRCLSNSGTFTELRTTPFIESTGVACSDSVCHDWVRVKYSYIVTRLQSGLNLQPPDDCLLRSLIYSSSGRSSKFREGSRVRQTPEEGQRTCRPKH